MSLSSYLTEATARCVFGFVASMWVGQFSLLASCSLVSCMPVVACGDLIYGLDRGRKFNN